MLNLCEKTSFYCCSNVKIKIQYRLSMSEYNFDPRKVGVGHVVRSLVNASLSATFRPRDMMTKGFIDQYRQEAGCVGNVVGDPIIYTLWVTSLLLTAPFI